MKCYILVVTALATLLAGCNSGPAVSLDELLLENSHRGVQGSDIRYFAGFLTSKLSGFPPERRDCEVIEAEVIEASDEGDAESAGQQSRETRSERLGPAITEEDRKSVV